MSSSADDTLHEELLPIVDAQGNVIGRMTRSEAHGGSHTLHPVVHLHLYNSKGELYLQHRPRWKDIQPDKWDTACGGHVDYGESIAEALHREVREELGIDLQQCLAGQVTFVARYVFDSDRESELVHVHRATYDGDVKPDANELDGGRFWTSAAIEAAMGKGVFTPNFEHEYRRFLRPV